MNNLNSDKNSLENEYVEELKCIQQIVHYSESFIEDNSEFDIEAVQDLLSERQPWIDILRNIESELKNNPNESEEIKRFKKEISELGNSLIALDAKIMDILAGQKQMIIKELMKSADNISRRGKRSEAPRIINIKQE
ncbi:MAG: hypothetical protein KAI81_02890 [Candidatus Marinimicrobia bacterium]|nr:hypothetical protein [Candidatus Neomarinimicrobiota bacterium]